MGGAEAIFDGPGDRRQMITERFAENNRLKRYAYDLIRKVFYKEVMHSFVASPEISLFYSSNPKRMKLKFLLASAVAIVGIAVYILTLSFMNSAPLLSHERFMGMAWVPVVVCVQGNGICTPYMPC